MKHITFLLIVAVTLFSCKKGDIGPTGPAGATGAAGPAGPIGPQGIAGNANVTQYTYGTVALNTGFKTLSVTTTLDTMNKSAWFVYLYYQPNDRWYTIPGGGPGGSSTYRVSFGYSAGKANIYIDIASGMGESFANGKVIRIYSSNQLPGGRMKLPDVDFTDYNTVKEYYHLPD